MSAISPLYVKLIGGALVALMLLTLVLDRGRWMGRAHGDEAQLATICAATRAAADNPKMDCKLAAQQIGELGKSIADLKAGLAKQNAAVTALATTSAAQQASATKASQEAAGRTREAEATAAALIASSRAGERLAKPCSPSKALQENWR